MDRHGYDLQYWTGLDGTWLDWNSIEFWMRVQEIIYTHQTNVGIDIHFNCRYLIPIQHTKRAVRARLVMCSQSTDLVMSCKSCVWLDLLVVRAYGRFVDTCAGLRLRRWVWAHWGGVGLYCQKHRREISQNSISRVLNKPV